MTDIYEDVEAVKQLRSFTAAFMHMSRDEDSISLGSYSVTKYGSRKAWKTIQVALRRAAELAQVESALLDANLKSLADSPTKVAALETEIQQLRAAVVSLQTPPAPATTELVLTHRINFAEAASAVTNGRTFVLFVDYSDDDGLGLIARNSDASVVQSIINATEEALNLTTRGLDYDLLISMEESDGSSVDLTPFLKERPECQS